MSIFRSPVQTRVYCFLDFQDLTSLDTALADQKLRPRFLLALQQLLWCYYPAYLPVHNEVLTWVEAKGVTIDHITLPCDTTADALVERIAAALPAVTSIQFSNTSTDTSISHLARRSHHLQRLSLAGCDGISASAVITLAQCCPRLRSIDISDTDAITDAVITILARNCPHLEEIELSSSRPVPVTEVAMHALCEHCQLLRHLGLSNCNRIRDMSLRIIGESLPLLQHISVSRCLLLSPLGWCELLNGCHRLRSIDISHTRIATLAALLATGRYSKHLIKAILSYSGVLDDDGVTELARGCPQLHTIDISHCDGITDDGLSALATYCPQLKSVNTSLCSNITSAGWVAVAQASRELQHVICDLNDVHDTMLAALGATCRSLNVLSMRACDGISSCGVCQLVRGCHALSEVDFAGCMITDEGIEALSAASPHLQSLNLSYNPVSDVGLFSIAEHCHKLLALHLCEAREVTDSGISAVATNNPHLQTLDASHCKITNTSLTVLSKYCHELTVVTMDNCSGISDRGLIALSCGNPELHILSIDNCNAITDTGIDALMTNCNALKELHVKHCKNISQQQLVARAQSLGLLICH